MSSHPIARRTSFLFMVHDQPTSLTNQADPSPREHLLCHTVSERLNLEDMLLKDT